MASHPLTNAEKSRKLPWALGGDVWNVVYVYWVMAGPVFLLFLDHLKLEKKQIGLLLSIMPLMGVTAIFAGPMASRIGVKRVFLTCWTIRKFIMAAMIPAPLVVAQYGLSIGFIYVAVVITLFSLCRSVGESSLSLWQHEFVPANRRGNYSAWQTVVVMVVGALSVTLAGQFLGEQPSSSKFQLLFTVGLFFGLMCVVFYSRVPGGEPMPVTVDAPRIRFKSYLEPLRDSRFRRMLMANTLVHSGWSMMVSFMPLFYRDYVKLSENQVVSLDAFYMAGQLCTCFLWGWTADRYGSKPQAVTNLALVAIYPIGLLFLPRENPYSFLIAGGILFTVGMIMPGWTIGFGRMLNVDLVPAEKKMIYVPLYMTWSAIILGASPYIAGFYLDTVTPFQTQWLWFKFDTYTPLMLICIVALVTAASIFASIPIRSKVPVSSFATMFMQGNPIAAMQAIIGFQYAGHEKSRMINVEKLGQTNSPLSIEELISALSDPSYNVRHEAIISISRTRQHPRLTQAMLSVLTQGTPDLRSTAAWALGRMGDRSAIPTLRQMLDSSYPLLRSRTARALAMLEDHESAPRIMALFLEEEDQGIAVAYAAALGALGQENAVGDMLAFLAKAQDQDTRQETSLAIATLLGRDGQTLRIWRRMIAQPGDTLGGIMLGLRRRLVRPDLPAEVAQPLGQALDNCTRQVSMENFSQGAAELVNILQHVRRELYTPLAQSILNEVEKRLAEHGDRRLEYLFLAVHTLHVGMIESARR